MKSKIKYITITIIFSILMFFSYFFGELRGFHLATYMHLENTLSTLNDLEKEKTDKVKTSLNSIMDLHIVSVEDASKYWLIPIDETNISGTYARISRYRKFSGYKYTPPDSFWLKTHKKANKIIYAK